jgi:hypothetical protein
MARNPLTANDQATNTCLLYTQIPYHSNICKMLKIIDFNQNMSGQT